MSRKKSKKTVDETVEVEKKPVDAGTPKDSVDSTYSSTINSTTKVLKNQQKSSNERAERTKFFATIVYPESAPANWKEIVRDTHVPTLISPLHDKDKDPDGNAKKAHYHVLMTFDSLKNFDTQIKPIFDTFGGVGREEVLSQRGYARYLCHMDNPEKYQYDPQEVEELNGACYSVTITLPTDEIGAVEAMIDFIEDNDIYSFRKLFMWCKDNQKDWFRLLASSKTYIIKEYLKSRFWDLENADKVEYLTKAKSGTNTNSDERKD